MNSNIIEFDTLSGILTATKIQNGGAHDCFSIELNFPVDPITEFSSTEVSAISKALNGARLVDIKRTAFKDDLFVILPVYIFLDFTNWTDVLPFFLKGLSICRLCFHLENLLLY